MMDQIILPRLSDQKPLVSVITKSYNHGLYIRDCMEGFLIQKTNFPVEFIIHDDASTDHTADIIQEYYKKRPDLFHVIIQRENQFSQKKPTIHLLYEIAQGKYIAICEGDDFWTESSKLQKQYDFMESNPKYSLCTHSNYVLNEKTKTYTKPFNNNTWIPPKDKEEEYLLSKKGADLPFLPLSFFFRKEGIVGYKEWLNEIKSKADFPFGDLLLMLYLEKSGLIYYDKSIMGGYRVQKNSVSRQKDFCKRAFVAHNYLRGLYGLPEMDSTQSYQKRSTRLIIRDYLCTCFRIARLGRFFYKKFNATDYPQRFYIHPF